MRKIIHGIEFRQEYSALDCFQQALQVVLQFYGYNKMENMLFDERRFVYRRGGASGVQISAGPHIGQKLSAHGISLLSRQAGDAKEAWSAMKHLIDESKPTPVLVDIHYIERHSLENATHSPHYVILSGYDKEQETVHIVDAGSKEDDIPLGNFECALNSPYLQSKNHWVEFDFSSDPVNHSPDIRRARIRKNVEVMLEGGKWADTFWGMEGIRTLAQDVEGWSLMDRELLIGYMKVCFEFLEEVVYSLKGHSLFLASACEILESPGLKDISLEVGKIAQRWLLLRNMFFKGSKKEPLAMLPRIHRKLLDIADREEQALIALKEVVKT